MGDHRCSSASVALAVLTSFTSRQVRPVIASCCLQVGLTVKHPPSTGKDKCAKDKPEHTGVEEIEHGERLAPAAEVRGCEPQQADGLESVSKFSPLLVSRTGSRGEDAEGSSGRKRRGKLQIGLQKLEQVLKVPLSVMFSALCVGNEPPLYVPIQLTPSCWFDITSALLEDVDLPHRDPPDGPAWLKGPPAAPHQRTWRITRRAR